MPRPSERPHRVEVTTPDADQSRVLDALAAIPTAFGWPDRHTPRTDHPLRFHVGWCGWATTALRPVTFTYPRTA